MEHRKLVQKWLVDSKLGKNQLVLFDWSNNTGAIDVKIDAGFELVKQN